MSRTSSIAVNSIAQLSTSPTSEISPETSRGLFSPGVLLALFVGGLFRFYPAFTHDFPLGDGGLFLVMARTLRENNFLLPSRVFYPTVVDSIPMCYPPLSFYEVAFLNVLGVPIETSLRLLPAFWATASIYAFWRLARALFAPWPQAELGAMLAALLWSLLPWTFLWQLMGGGITRAPGLCFGLLGLEAGVRLWRDKEKTLFWVAVLLALTIATHLQQARFLFLSLGLVAIAYGRSWRSLGQWFLVLGIAVLLTAPWWSTCVARFGLEPFQASMKSGSSAWGRTGPWKILVGGEFLIPVISLTGLVGFWSLRRQLPMLPVWLIAILLIEVRSPLLFITLPLALSAGLTLAQMKSHTWRYALLSFLVLWGVFQSSAIADHYRIVTPSQREAMRWARENTPETARFLIVPAEIKRTDWAGDLLAEWFPVLAKRHSIITVQGSEWLPNQRFKHLSDHYKALAQTNDWAGFEAQARKRHLEFDYLFLPRVSEGAPKTTAFLQAVERGLSNDPQFSPVFSNRAISIWRRDTP